MTANVPRVGSRDETVKWFDQTVTVPPQARDLLETYSRIPADKVEDHVLTIVGLPRVRNTAWEVWPYPCLGQFRFLELSLSAREDLYPRLLSRLKAGGRFLDVGCCLGQDIRKLVHDGVPGENLVGAELNGDFIDLGYELFRDRDMLKAKFITADILDGGGAWKEFEESLDVVQLGMILHLFTWDEQVKVFKQAISLLKPGTDGVAIIGQAVGNVDGLPAPAWDRSTFRHNVDTFRRLIDEVSAETGTQWNVTASLDDGLSIFDGKRTWDDPKTRRLLFEVEKM